ncbi:MAG: ATP-binding protein [Nitrososphaerota archaeon]
MVNVQELISRGRLIFSGAPERLEVFKLVNGKRSNKEIARKMCRSLSSVLHDIEKLRDMELVREKKDSKGNLILKEGTRVYEKNPLIKHIPLSYFEDVARTDLLIKKTSKIRVKGPKPPTIHVPSEREILDICRNGEDQMYEFKAPGIDVDKITKEIAGFLHTKNGGIIFYGIDDDGSIVGSDVRRQDFDQKIQNSIRNTISPQPTVYIKDRNVMGSRVIMIIIPPWDRKTIYQYTKDRRYYIRRGTNIFALKPEEISRLSRGETVV